MKDGGDKQGRPKKNGKCIRVLLRTMNLLSNNPIIRADGSYKEFVSLLDDNRSVTTTTTTTSTTSADITIKKSNTSKHKMDEINQMEDSNASNYQRGRILYYIRTVPRDFLAFTMQLDGFVSLVRRGVVVDTALISDAEILQLAQEIYENSVVVAPAPVTIIHEPENANSSMTSTTADCTESDTTSA